MAEPVKATPKIRVLNPDVSGDRNPALALTLYWAAVDASANTVVVVQAMNPCDINVFRTKGGAMKWAHESGRPCTVLAKKLDEPGWVTI